ncbi:TPA: hypothetical protein ACWW9G_004569 [Klebsiella pneumoniae]|uniref:hypothetical protein n=1 Tax=Klebsiella pneumoniae TaxID=573 RepID=UPI000BB60D0E|nr:hypothetical protein [Klebsiella pneumoniae]PBP07306.1 hypothetical protein CI705_23375 [Klebsiella pneumoniae subsp. pneumoniae]NBZ57933.1 hypothetical protein [Klebsiella pneumoniae]HBW9607132.1 hypothetical protein [Klebsiella pneumoniae]HBZ4073371.1 hypothetical protein [Klebsiella pneumoniae]
MTKSTITRERIQLIILVINSEAYNEEEIREWLSSDEIMELSRMALAAMDSEPDCKERKLFCSTDTTRMRKTISVSAGTEDAPLYRHAQPAPEKYNIGDATKRHIFTPTGMTNVSDMQAVFDRVEAVLVGMDQPAPVVPVVPDDVLDALRKVARIRLDLNDFDGDRRGIVDCLSDAEEALIEVVNSRAAMLAAAPQEVKGE